MDPECRACTVRRTTIFSDLPPDELERLGKLLRLNRHRKHQILFVEGDVGRYIYLVKSGAIKVSRSLSDGREQILRILGPGDVLGWEALFGESYKVTAENLGESEICSIAQADFSGLLETNVTLTRGVLRALFKELMKAQERIRDLGLKSARERVATLLLSVPLPCCQKQPEGQKIHLSLSRREISELIGVAQETVSRVLSELRHDGIIELHGRDIRVLDRQQLSRLAG
ncbi:MAG: Crp/Fnr family transcriptional regulator [Candidatus Binatia bacterium]